MHDIGRLAALIAVADHGSITKAASHLGYTPTALSQQLAKLEREAGATLLVRHRTGSELTAAGKVLAGYARQILDLVQRARHDLTALREAITGQIQIGTFATGAVHLLPSVLTAFGRDHPQVELSLREYEPPSGITAVASGAIDLALTHDYEYGNSVIIPRNLSCEVLVREPLLLVANAERAQKWAPGPVALRELAECPLITGGPGLANREALEALFRLRELPRPTVVFETADYALACALSAAGMGMALVPVMAIDDWAGDQLSVRPLAPPLHRTISMVWRTEDESPALRALRQLIRDSYQRPRLVPDQGN